MRFLVFAMIVLGLSVGCTKKEEPAALPAAAPQSAPAAGGPEKLAISAVGETMVYDKTELTVKAGSKVELTFKNPSTTQKHNWVLTSPGKESEVAVAGIQAGEANGFVPNNPAVLAHTKLVAPGGEDTVSFTAPAVGDYPFECTFPGHNAMMHGVLKVTP